MTLEQLCEKMMDDCNLYQMDGAISKPLDFKQANQLIQRYILKLDVPVDRLFKTASRS